MDDEVARRLVHASGAILPTTWVVGQLDAVPELPWQVVRYVLVLATILALGLEVIRLFVGLDWAIFEKLTREYEQENLAGYALYIIGGTFAGLLFVPEVAVPAMYMLTIGDPISGLLGSGELRTVKRPRVLGTMFVVSLAFALPFLPVVAAVGAAVASTLADGVKPVVATYVIDDNLTIPILASMAAAAVLVATGEPVEAVVTAMA
ncbi:dolichol kinase [Haloarchaeobius salinus]|uniref:dolichol kinase n=1 Tax=Haloarchaeobius salinus TaxID=1198298 RepID=UPI00210A7B54|nr:dolichol kinase [Haloarchaeobius salinus]